MCAADRAVKLDIDEAYAAGREAARLAGAGISRRRNGSATAIRNAPRG